MLTKTRKADLGLKSGARLHQNLDTPHLVELALRRGEARLAGHGPLVVETGRHTGRSAQDKFIVQDSSTADTIWWGKTNKPMIGEAFEALLADFHAHIAALDDVFVDTWEQASDYDHAARVLADLFRRNFTQFADSVDVSIHAAAPSGLFDA